MTDGAKSRKSAEKIRQQKAEEIRVLDILEEFEEHGLVKRIWDDKKQDYVWDKTDLGHKVAKELDIE